MENELEYEIDSMTGVDEIEDYDKQNNYYNDFGTDGSCSVNTEIARQRKISNDYKKTDKNYNIVNKKVDGKIIKIEFYDTNISMGSTIRNAVTGDYQKGHNTGSFKENLFFKVIHTCAENKNKEPKILFYDSPEQWEKHFRLTCPNDVKTKWKSKYDIELKRIETRKLYGGRQPTKILIH